MTMRRFLQVLLPILTLAAVTTLGPIAPARAGDSSLWADSTRSRMRLIAGAPAKDAAVLRAGVEIELQDGWKTYWRYPGDAGVPPRFDFSRSENVDSIEVAWPAPRRFNDAGGTAIGYKENVIFPVRVKPRDAAKPVTLRLDLDYAVCEKLCVPEQAHALLALDGAPGTFDAQLSASEATVPSKALPGGSGALAVRTVTTSTAGARPRITIEVASPAGAQTELFAEGPTPDWALPVPLAQPGPTPDTQSFSFDLDGVPSGASTKGAMLTLTVVAGDQAIEVPARLD